MSELTALIELQNLDNLLEQLRYRHEHMPERQALAAVRADLATLDAASARTHDQREQLRRDERGFEDEANDIDEKAKRLEARLYDGSVTSPKEATALGDEIAAMKARQSDLEDRSIGILVDIEPLDEELAQAEAARGPLAASEQDLMSTIAANEAEIEAEIATAEKKRAETSTLIDDARMTQYKKLRITYGPDAIVEFDAKRGGGCPVAMSAVELDRWKHLPAGSIGNCVDCGRLVVKTA